MKLVGMMGAVVALPLASPAAAEVVAATGTTMEISQVVTVDAPITQVWDTLRAP